MSKENEIQNIKEIELFGSNHTLELKNNILFIRYKKECFKDFLQLLSKKNLSFTNNSCENLIEVNSKKFTSFKEIEEFFEIHHKINYVVFPPGEKNITFDRIKEMIGNLQREKEERKKGKEEAEYINRFLKMIRTYKYR